MKRWLIKDTIFILCLLIGTEALGADEDTVYQMPMAETQEIATHWMEQNGFQVFRNPSVLGTHLELAAQKGDVAFELILMPQSPLATRVHFQSQANQASAYIKVLKGYLGGYLSQSGVRPGEAELPIPAPVLALQESVVCIYARIDNNDFQLSGFVLDPRGVIICTAHDLTAGHRVRVVGQDGREVHGRVIHIDWEKDLAMIRTNAPFVHAVSLKNGRYLLQNGDALFAVTCPLNGNSAILPGFLDGPPRRVQGLPLWQVQMHIEHGSSGSPVFDEQGRLTAIVKGRYRGTNSIGFLIPFETLLHFLDKY